MVSTSTRALRVAGGDQLGCLDAVHARHADVHDDHVGAGVPGELDRLGSGSGLAGHVDVGCLLDQHAQARADQRLVVGQDDPDGHRAGAGSGQPGGDAEAAAGARAGREVAAEQRGALAHAGDPVAGPGHAAAAPAVGDLDGQLPVLLVDADLALAGAGVADHVGDRLLDDAERRQVDVGRERLPAAAPVHVDLHARVQGRGGQPVDVGQAGRRAQRRLPGPGSGLGAPQPGHHPPQPGQRLPAGGLDGGQGVARLVGTGVEDPAARACLDRDDADAVRHDVVQFAGDPQPLGHRGLGGCLGPHQLGPGLCLPDRMSDQPGNDRDKGYGDRDQGYRRPRGASPERAPESGTARTGISRPTPTMATPVTETLRVRVAAM